MSNDDSLSDSPSDQELLDRCPFCEYSLEGQPIVHRCPECGGVFDRRWEIFGGLSRWHALRIWRRIGTVLVLALFALMLLDDARTALGFPRVFLTVHVPWMIDALGLGLLVWTVFTRPPSFVGVHRKGIFICDRKARQVEHIEWTRIGSTGSLTWRGLALTVDGNLRYIDAWRGNIDQYESFLYALKSRGGVAREK